MDSLLVDCLKCIAACSRVAGYERNSDGGGMAIGRDGENSKD